MISAPIFIDAQGDLLVYPSAGDLLRSVTPEQIRAGAFPVIYDADGRLLRLSVRTEEYRLLGLVPRVRERMELEATEHLPTHDVALRTLLLRFVSPRTPPPEGRELHPLAGLVRR